MSLSLSGSRATFLTTIQFCFFLNKTRQLSLILLALGVITEKRKQDNLKSARFNPQVFLEHLECVQQRYKSIGDDLCLKKFVNLEEKKNPHKVITNQTRKNRINGGKKSIWYIFQKPEVMGSLEDEVAGRLRVDETCSGLGKR